MKKRLESELISIAHRILKLKNKSEVDQLHLEAKKLYETLTVLKFYVDNYEQIKSEISQNDLEEKLDNSSVEVIASTVGQEIVKKDNENLLVEEVISVVEIKEEVSKEKTVDETEKEESFDTIFELASGEMSDELEDDKIEIEEKTEPKQISFEELLGKNYTEPVFVKPNENSKKADKEKVLEDVIVAKTESKPKSLNDILSKGINIGLNDRIAFVKHLFADSNEDFNRVISQLNTFDSIDEASEFIESMVKPDYNDWKGKDDYAARFIEMVEKKFS